MEKHHDEHNSKNGNHHQSSPLGKRKGEEIEKKMDSKQAKSNFTAEEQEILNIVADWRKGLEEKDFDRMFQNYHPDVVLYDLKPPSKIVGVKNVRDMWEQCLPYFPEKFTSEHADVDVTVDGNLAFFHGLHRFTALVDEEKWKDQLHWVRVTVCYKKVDGKWLAIHEHVSIPFDPISGMVSPCGP